LKEIDRLLLDFTNQYVKSTHNSDVVLMLKKVKEMQENQNKLQKVVLETQRKFFEMNAKQTKIASPTVTITLPTQVIPTASFLSKLC